MFSTEPLTLIACIRFLPLSETCMIRLKAKWSAWGFRMRRILIRQQTIRHPPCPAMHDAHLCLWSMPFLTRRRSSSVRAPCPKLISSVPSPESNRTRRRCERELGDVWTCASSPIPTSLQVGSVWPGDKAPATRDVEHLYSSFEIPRRAEERRDAGSMRSACRGWRGVETPTGTETASDETIGSQWPWAVIFKPSKNILNSKPEYTSSI